MEYHTIFAFPYFLHWLSWTSVLLFLRDVMEVYIKCPTFTGNIWKCFFLKKHISLCLKEFVCKAAVHGDVIKWKHFPHYWPFVRGIHRHKGQWRGALVFSLIYARINGWVNTGEAGDLRGHQAHYDVIAELPTCTHFVYFVHKNGNMKFVHHIEAFVHIKWNSNFYWNFNSCLK